MVTFVFQKINAKSTADKSFIKEYMKGGSALNWEDEQFNEINIVSVESPSLPEISSNNNHSTSTYTSVAKPKIKLSENEQKVIEVTGTCKNWNWQIKKTV